MESKQHESLHKKELIDEKYSNQPHRRTKRKAPLPPVRPASLTEDMPGFVTEFHKAQEKTQVVPISQSVMHPPQSRPYEDYFPSLEAHFMEERHKPPCNPFNVDQWLEMACNQPYIRSSPMNYPSENLPITRGSTDLALKFRSRPALKQEVLKPVEILPAVNESRSVDNKKGQQLDRSDSVVTVAHLYEDLVVSNRFRVKVTLTNLTVVVLLAAFLLPNFAAVLFGVFRLVFGTLFPAYYSYKAVRTKNVKEYVKWMMYWIVFAFFTCAETITDIFLAFWFPFYYEAKILVVLWLLSPATRGSSIIYRKFVHPWLIQREDEIDECISKAKQQGYSTVVELSTKGVNYATSIIMQTAIKGGGGLVNTLKRSYSTSDVGEEGDLNRNVKALSNRAYDETDFMEVEEEPRYRSESESHPRSRGQSMGRSKRAAKVRSADISEVYGTDAAEIIPQRRSPRTHDVMSRETLLPLSQEPLLEGLQPRKNKTRKAAGRTKSFTIGDTRATKQALLELQEESSLSSIPELSRGFATLPRRMTRSLRSRPSYVR